MDDHVAEAGYCGAEALFSGGGDGDAEYDGAGGD